MDESIPASSTGEDPTARVEAFQLLSDRTRLEILYALWEGHDPLDPAPMRFSELRERLDVEDPGRLNYHLSKLADHFIRRTENGYELRRTGHQVVRTVIAGASVESPTLERTHIDLRCEFCGAPTAVTYRDEWLFVVCTQCDGFFEGDETHPEGYLMGAALDPAGFIGREPAELLHASMTVAFKDLLCAVEGVCNACSGQMSPWLEICQEHADSGVCEGCGRRFAAICRFECEVCKNHLTVSPRTVVVGHPAVVAFYYDHGISLQYDDVSATGMQRRLALIKAHEQSIVSRDPPRVEVEVSHEGESLRLLLDDAVRVSSAERSSGDA